jgi:hypothetical protein
MSNIIVNIIIIVASIIVIISLCIWMISNIKFVNINSKFSNLSSIVMIVILIIFLVGFPILFLRSTSFEKFDSNSTPYNGFLFQTGRSGIQPTGTITFKVPFQATPKIMTQIIGNDSSTTNVYSIQVFNVSNTGFNYAKNMMVNSTSGQLTMSKLIPSTVEPFDWIAFG